MGELRALSKDKEAARKQREQTAVAAARKKRLAKFAADPKKALAEVECLVATRSTDNYHLAAQQIADVREALGPVDSPLVASKFAEKIRRDNPKRSGLVAALKSHQLLSAEKRSIRLTRSVVRKFHTTIAACAEIDGQRQSGDATK
jgi:hypothetical protein